LFGKLAGHVCPGPKLTRSDVRAESVLALIGGHALNGTARQFRADTVGKVFLRDGTQILRAAGATIEK
jgi:hypothetical protein